MDWTPAFSRRARGFAVYAALRSLGQQGVTELIERTCAPRSGQRRGMDERNDLRRPKGHPPVGVQLADKRQ
jgi:glutamate/tyrosine decarboxylase-like PLP-dependent enzyme